MRLMERYAITLIFSLLFFSCLAVPQTPMEFDKDAEKRFSTGLREYNQGNYAKAIEDFDHVAKMSLNQRSTAAAIMLAKSHYRVRQYGESMRIAREFIDKFPQSMYVDDARFTVGLNYEAQYRYPDALLHYLLVVETTGNQTLRKKAESFSVHIADERLSIDELNTVLRDIRGPSSEDLVRVRLSKKQLGKGAIHFAEKTLEPVIARRPPTPYRPEADELMEKIRQGVSVKIGALLPLAGSSTQKHIKQYGEDFLLGMEYALDEIRGRNVLIQTSLETRDTDRDPALAVRFTHELGSDPSVVAVIGPVFNNEATPCAATANALRIPLLSPTANVDGLAATGPFIFQCNPDMTTRGKAAAQYAATVLGYQTVAVVAPNDGMGKAMAAAFTYEALRLGCRVVATEWYAPGSTDLREQLLRVRKASLIEAEPLFSFAGRIMQTDIMRMLELGVRARTIDSLMERGGEISVYQLFGPDGKRIADSLQLRTYVPQTNVDNLELPAAGIQAIYLPINSPQEIPILSSQLAYYNIKTQLLGSHDWYNPVELDASRRYLEGLLMFSDFFTDQNDSALTHFSQGWFEKTKRRPTPNAIIGYGVMKLVGLAILDGASTRESLVSALSSVEQFQALHTPITLTNGRINSELHVLRFTNGEVVKVGHTSVQ
jgi:ABC-type branched-subunit amino acid transport system substrate-binding protein